MKIWYSNNELKNKNSYKVLNVFTFLLLLWGYYSMYEGFLSTVEIIGGNPLSRQNFQFPDSLIVAGTILLFFIIYLF